MRIGRAIAILIPLLIVGAGSIFFMNSLAGPSAGLCQDTIEDNAIISQCIRHQRCPFKGIGTSFGRFHQGLAWHNARILLAYAGLTIHQVFLLVRFLNAMGMGMVLLLIAAWRIFGGVSAALGLVSTAFVMVRMDFDPWILNNSNIIFFLGTLVTFTGLAAVQSRQTWVILAFAAITALVADTHIAAVPMVISLLWIVWLVRPKGKFMVITGLVWALVLFLLSPGTWIATIHSLGSLTKGTGGQLISAQIVHLNLEDPIKPLPHLHCRGNPCGYPFWVFTIGRPQGPPLRSLFHAGILCFDGN